MFKEDPLKPEAPPSPATEAVHQESTDSLAELRFATSKMLDDIVASHTTDRVSVGDIMSAIHERGFGILLIIFAIPNCIPIPAPPFYSTVTSLPLFFLAWQMFRGMEKPWLPKWLERKSIERKTLALLVTKANPWIRKVEKILHPRMTFMTSHAHERVISIFVFIATLIVVLPIPGANLIPSYSILLMGIGLVGRDGLFVLGGKILGVLGIALAAAIIILGERVVHYLLSYIL